MRIVFDKSRITLIHPSIVGSAYLLSSSSQVRSHRLSETGFGSTIHWIIHSCIEEPKCRYMFVFGKQKQPRNDIDWNYFHRTQSMNNSTIRAGALFNSNLKATPRKPLIYTIRSCALSLLPSSNLRTTYVPRVLEMYCHVEVDRWFVLQYRRKSAWHVSYPNANCSHPLNVHCIMNWWCSLWFVWPSPEFETLAAVQWNLHDALVRDSNYYINHHSCQHD